MRKRVAVTDEAPCWSGRVEQELTCAAQADEVTARKAHLELAILHLDADRDNGDGETSSREVLTTALFARMAFALD